MLSPRSGLLLVVVVVPVEQLEHLSRGLLLVWQELHIEAVAVSLPPCLKCRVNRSSDVQHLPPLPFCSVFGELEVFEVLPSLAPLEDKRTLYGIPAYSVKLFFNALAVVRDVAVELVYRGFTLDHAGTGKIPSLNDKAVIAVVKLPRLEHYAIPAKLGSYVLVFLFSCIDEDSHFFHKVFFLVTAQRRTPRNLHGNSEELSKPW